MSTSPLRVAIVGGGIGGVAAANALLQRGMEVRLYEQAAALTPRLPAGISLLPASEQSNTVAQLTAAFQLNLTALSQSISEAVRRHESLRTTFPAVDGRPIQVAGRAQNLDLPIVDLSSLPELQRSEVTRQLVNEGARRRFDLAAGPLFQASLFRVAEEEHVLLVLLHHRWQAIPAADLSIFACELIERNGDVLKGIVRAMAADWKLEPDFFLA